MISLANRAVSVRLAVRVLPALPRRPVRRLRARRLRPVRLPRCSARLRLQPRLRLRPRPRVLRCRHRLRHRHPRHPAPRQSPGATRRCRAPRRRSPRQLLPLRASPPPGRYPCRPRLANLLSVRRRRVRRVPIPHARFPRPRLPPSAHRSPPPLLLCRRRRGAQPRNPRRLGPAPRPRRARRRPRRPRPSQHPCRRPRRRPLLRQQRRHSPRPLLLQRRRPHQPSRQRAGYPVLRPRRVTASLALARRRPPLRWLLARLPASLLLPLPRWPPASLPPPASRRPRTRVRAAAAVSGSVAPLPSGSVPA